LRKTDKPIAVVNGNKKHADSRLEKNFRQTPMPTQAI